MTNEAEMFRAAGEALASSDNPAVLHVRKLAEEHEQLEASIAYLETSLGQLKVRLNVIKVKDMPDAMAALGSTDWTSIDKKYHIVVDDFVSGTLPKDPDQRQDAVALITEYGGGDLVTTEVVLSFVKSEHNMAIDAIELLKEHDHDPDVHSGIHPQSLLAFVRERVRKGEDVDFPKLGLFNGRKASIKSIKAHKKKGQNNDE